MADYLEHLNIVPEHMHEAIQRYIEHGIPPGSFLTAVLCNDLQGSFSHADLENRRALFYWTQFLYNYVPGSCHGSPERVEQWVKQGGLEGLISVEEDHKEGEL